MAYSRAPVTLLALSGLFAAACGGGSSVSNASPRISEVPQQSVAGGATFTLDLSDYVTDRESSPLTYTVDSGGGAFSGADYTNTFDTMGEYDVTFTVTDGAKTNTGTFRVKVTSANLAVVREAATGLLLLDTKTNKFVRVAGAVSQPSFETGLADGRVVYSLDSGDDELWIFDPLTRTNTRVAAGAEGGVQYRAKTSDDRLLYTTGALGEQKLFIYNVTSGVSRDIAQDLLSTFTLKVNDDDMIFYEVNVNGQADIYGYDPDEDEAFAIGTADTDEQIDSVLPNGALQFRRRGPGGESDLFYYRFGAGLVEIGADIADLGPRNKLAWGHDGSAGQVVFTALNGSNRELYFWDPATGQSTAIGTGVNCAVDGIGVGNELVYRVLVSDTEHDLYSFDLDDGTNDTLRNDSDLSVVTAVVDDGTNSWALVRGSGDTATQLAIPLVSSPSAVSYSAGGAVGPGGALANGDYVVVRDDDTALCLFDTSAGTWGAPITGAGLDFSGDGLEDGDCVFEATVTAQQDLLMWDASAGSAVTLSNTTGDDSYQLLTSDSTILFTRIVAGNTNADLFVWDGAAETQLTDVDAAGLRYDYTVLGKYAGSR